MTESDTAGLDWRGELAQELTVLAMRHSQVSHTFGLLRQEFRRHLDRLDATRRAAGEVRPAAGAFGAWLAEIGITGDEPVRRIVHALGAGFSAKASSPSGAAGEAAELVDLLAAVASGYGNAIRESTFKQQEHIKRALVQAKMDVERDLYTSENRFGEVFASTAIGIAISDLDGTVEQSNPALHRIVERGDRELHGTSIFDLFEPGAAEELRAEFAALASIRDGSNRFTRKAQVLLPDADTNWVDLSVALLRDQSGAADHYATIVSDVSDLYHLSQRLHQQTLHDMVTGQPNRQFLASRLAQVMEQHADRPDFWLYHVDLDDFAAPNNRFGRATGDQLLQVVADRLAQFATGKQDMLARADGDQFLLLVEHAESDPRALADQLLATVSEPIEVAGSPLRLTISIGIAGHAADRQAEQVLTQADIALRQARNQGGACAVLFEPVS